MRPQRAPGNTVGKGQRFSPPAFALTFSILVCAGAPACAIEAARAASPAMAESDAAALLGSTHRDTRLRALRALADAKSEAGRALLLQALAEPDGAVRAEAVGALVRAGHEEALNAVVPALADPQYRVRLAAATALAKSGAGAVSALRRQMKSPDWVSRRTFSPPSPGRRTKPAAALSPTVSNG